VCMHLSSSRWTNLGENTVEAEIKLLLDSYGLEGLLEENDITQEYVVRLLFREKMLERSDFFEEEEDE
jgi:hypothetical protein